MVAAIIVAMTTKVAIIVRAELDIVYVKTENLVKVIKKKNIYKIMKWLEKGWSFRNDCGIKLVSS